MEGVWTPAGPWPVALGHRAAMAVSLEKNKRQRELLEKRRTGERSEMEEEREGSPARGLAGDARQRAKEREAVVGLLVPAKCERRHVAPGLRAVGDAVLARETDPCLIWRGRGQRRWCSSLRRRPRAGGVTEPI